MSNDLTWILVADATTARVYEKPANQKHISDAPKYVLNREQARDGNSHHEKLGRTHDIIGESRHNIEPATDPARYEQRLFARDIMQHLDDGRKRKAFDQLIIVAPPQFLGDLRKTLSPKMKSVVSDEVAKHLAHLPVDEIDDHLGTLLRPYEH